MAVVKLAEFEDGSQRVLQLAKQAGVVLDYILCEQVDQVSSDRAHRSALHVGISEASRRRSLPQPNHHPDSIEGNPVSLYEFYGTTFDVANRRLLMPAGIEVVAQAQSIGLLPSSAIGPYTWADNDDIDHLVWFDKDALPTWGYASAFTRPPRGLRVPHLAAQRLFLIINDMILGSPAADAEIWSWRGSSEWAEYFEAGEDWWGAVAWTVRLSPDSLVIIGASAGDR